MNLYEMFGKAKQKSKDGSVSLIANLTGKGKGKFKPTFTVNSDLDIARSKNFARNPIMPNAADIVCWNLWDTFKVAANTSMGASFNYFTQPIGTNSKTKMDTNLEQVQRLPDPLWMNVIAMGFQFGPEVTFADLQTLVNNYYVEFWVGGKVYVEGRYEFFPSGTGITGSIATTVATSSPTVLNNGHPNWTNLFDLRLPPGLNLGGGQPSDGLMGVTILQGQQFKIVSNAPGGAQSTSAGGGGMRIIANLYGILSRGVQ